jgi:hypothetical protein
MNRSRAPDEEYFCRANALAYAENWAKRVRLGNVRADMSCAEPLHTETIPSGDVALVGNAVKAELVSAARNAGLLVVELGRPGPADRGRIALFIEEAVEEELRTHGASPPGVGASSNLDASLSDQLYRARLVRKRGLALSFGPLAGIANLAGALDAEDSAVLRWWMRSTRERPIRLMFDVSDRFLGVYAAPATLDSFVTHGPEFVPSEPRQSPSEPPSPSPEVAASIAAMELCISSAVASGCADMDLPAPEHDGPSEAALRHVDESVADAAAELEPRDSDGADLGAAAAPEAQRFAQTDEHDAIDFEPAAAVPHDSNAAGVLLPNDFRGLNLDATAPSAASGDTAALTLSDARLTAESREAAPTEMPRASSTESGSLAAAMARLLSDDDDEDERVPLVIESVEPIFYEEPLVAQTAAPSEDVAPRDEEHGRTTPIGSMLKRGRERSLESAAAHAMPAVERPEPARTAPAPVRTPAPEEWMPWVRELENARGPKPLAVIERLFVSAYVPLSEAVLKGVDDPRVHAALSAWSTSFDKSYRDAFDALRLRGKRPTMVLDVPDLALRIGRLHGARSTQLVLVDGMRFDLGLRVQDRLRELLGQHAALTERLLLWSALPTTTAMQLELIGRGPNGLRDMTTPSEAEPPVARGRGASTLRRVKTGQRELMKLDLVEARLAEPSTQPVTLRMDSLAEDVAEALAAHFTKLPPRTLVMLFGDHGFCIDNGESSGHAIRQGGAMPEEVLVPAFAWIVGPVH